MGEAEYNRERGWITIIERRGRSTITGGGVLTRDGVPHRRCHMGWSSIERVGYNRGAGVPKEE